MHIEENVKLQPYTTFKIGGIAPYFCRAQTVQELKEAVIFSKEKRIPFFVLGGGSNMVISDEGFPGLVIKNEIKCIELNEGCEDKVLVTIGAGENWDYFVEKVVKQGLYGVENLSAIPGTVGAAPVQNIGAYGVEIRSVVEQVEVYDTEKDEIINFDNARCNFSYRDSFFKTDMGKKYIITRVVLKLRKKGCVDISYKDVKHFFEETGKTNPSLEEVRNAIIEIRSKKLPDLNVYGTAGSFFKNPVVTIKKYEELKAIYPQLPCFVVDESHVKVPLGWILDFVCGFKGYRKGNVGVYQNQALVLVNFGNATALEVKMLAQEMADKVKEMTGITIEAEVQFI